MASCFTVFVSLAFTASFINIVCLSSTYNSEHFQHFIAVSNQGNDEPRCLNSSSRNSSLEKPCKTLDYAFNSTKNATEVILIAPGIYNLTVNATFNEIFDFKLIGSSTKLNVTVSCSSEVGFTFTRSKNIYIHGITFTQCGRLHKSTVGSAFGRKYTHIPFHAGVFFAYSRDINIEDSTITNSRGIGLVLYDVGGNVKVINSIFSRNSPSVENNCTHEYFYTRSGGGVYVEFTYNGALPPFNKSDPERFYYQNNNNFLFHKCNFEENLAPEQCFTNRIALPKGNDHMPFGRGGGLSFFLKGETKNNIIEILDCNFYGNQAVWGAGLFVEFHDSSQNNTLRVARSNFTCNSNSTAGGGIRSGIPIGEEKLKPNNIIHEECIFKNNSARMGGGVSHYGQLYHPYDVNDDKRKVIFRKCIWSFNKATMGSAIGLATSALDLPLSTVNPCITEPILPYMAYLEDCSIVGNQIILTEDKIVIGQGALYSFTVPVALKGSTKFENNENTAVLLDAAILKVFNGSTLFLNNTGLSGGGIAMYGMSLIDLMPGSKLYFKRNNAKEKGGAIFVDSSGPPVVAFETTELNTRPCFLGYNDSLTLQNINDWNTSITFDSNHASVGGGKSVYATTLQGCRQPGEGRINNKTLQWDFVHYLRPKNDVVDIGDEVATDPIMININESDWKMSPGEEFDATINLVGEKGSFVQGVVKLSIDANSSNTYLGIPSPLLLINDIDSNTTVPGLMVMGQCGSLFNLSLRTVSGQTVKKQLSNLTLLKCNEGFHLDFSKEECVCSKDTVLGISRCSSDKRNVYIRNGYWAGPVGGVFDAYACPKGYCSNINLTSRDFKLHEKDLCAPNRDSSVPLCGQCKKGYSVSLGSDNCISSKTCNKERLWLLLVFFLLMLIFVLLVLKINIDIFTAYLNAWLFSYQVILFLIKENEVFDSFISFVIGLANWRIHVTGFCFLPGLTNFYKLGINYILPFYVLFVLFVLSKVSRFFPRCYINQNISYALCNLLVLCYTDITTISFSILHYVHLGNKRILYSDGDIDFYDDWKIHLPFTLLAIALVIFFVILLPLTLLFTPWFFNKFPFFVRFRLFFDIFQRCFEDKESGKNYRWFAAFYFLSRIWILVMALYLPLGPLKRSLLETSCIVILSIVLYVQPYNSSYKWLNTLDAVLLANLCLITVFSSALTSDANTLTIKVFKILINILAYVPLVYLVCLAVYYGHKYLKEHRYSYNPVRLMDENSQSNEGHSNAANDEEDGSPSRNLPL